MNGISSTPTVPSSSIACTRNRWRPSESCVVSSSKVAGGSTMARVSCSSSRKMWILTAAPRPPQGGCVFSRGEDPPRQASRCTARRHRRPRARSLLPGPRDPRRPASPLREGVRWSVRASTPPARSWCRGDLPKREQVLDEGESVGGSDDHLARGCEGRGNRHHDVTGFCMLLRLEVPAVRGHHRLQHDSTRIVEVDQMPDVAGLSRSHVGEVRTRALGAQQRRVLSGVVGSERGSAKGSVHGKVPHELRMAEAAPLLEIELPPTLLLDGPYWRSLKSRRLLHLRRRQDRGDQRENEVAEAGESSDRSMVPMEPWAHQARPVNWVGVAGIGSTRRADGRMAHTLTAKATWLPAMSSPPTVRHNHSGSAATIEAMKERPPTQAAPCSTPATDSATT